MVKDGTLYPAQYDFTIVKPSQFRIKTSADLLQEYSDASNAGLPLFIRQRMAMDFVDKQYSGDAVMKKKAQILTKLDAYMLSNSNLPQEAARSHDILNRLDGLIQEKGTRWFVMADIQHIRAVLEY